MIKKLLAVLLSLFAAAAFAAVDVNKATQADLESIKGIGPVIATKILDERKKAPFKDWGDMVTRVKGIGENNAAKFSTDGLTVNGAAFANAPAAAKKDTKAAAAAGATTKTDAAPKADASMKAAGGTAKAGASTNAPAATPKTDTAAGDKPVKEPRAKRGTAASASSAASGAAKK